MSKIRTNITIPIEVPPSLENNQTISSNLNIKIAIDKITSNTNTIVLNSGATITGSEDDIFIIS